MLVPWLDGIEDPDNDLATAGGTDEAAEAEGDALLSGESVDVPLPLAAFGGSNRFGTLVHGVLESVDFTAEPLVEHLGPVVAHHVARSGLPIVADDLAAGLAACVETPLGDIFDGRRLRDIAPADRLNEMRFQLNMGNRLGSTPRDGGHTDVVAASEISEVLCRHVGEHDPLHRWAASLAKVLNPSMLAGCLEGFVDLIVRLRNDDGPDRFLVVDYKTNNLTPPGQAPSIDHYRPDALVAAMTRSHYPLQAVLYTVALHRYLRYRITGYRPEQHLGGVAYLFLRGMVGAETPLVDGQAHGVFAWRPAASMIEELSDILDGAPVVPS